jgi:AcrR family transcriptional regulator
VNGHLVIKRNLNPRLESAVMPRPKQVTDEEILRAAFRAIARLGPAALTLADVAREAGVTAGALVQRFGSKRALLLAAAADAAGGQTYFFAGLRAAHRSPLGALLGMADCMAILGSTPDEVAHSLAFLQWDLTDREFQAHARVGSTVRHAQIAALVRDAIAAGELRRCDAARLARTIQAALNGSILGWILHREGTLAAWIRRDLRMVIEPYRRSP